MAFDNGGKVRQFDDGGKIMTSPGLSLVSVKNHLHCRRPHLLLQSPPSLIATTFNTNRLQFSSTTMHLPWPDVPSSATTTSEKSVDMTKGKVVAKFCAKYLHQQVLKHEAYSAGDIGTSVQKAFFSRSGSKFYMYNSNYMSLRIGMHFHTILAGVLLLTVSM
ncbi:hypothetical protein RJ639_004047 [Escallonia herrerae]|uniref:Uncharacterized protein n=1 Tax=Escallonia herrerae TaxID=1293975 RepID=A0AA88W540_9ASTE|nr:hypothetical protein RJ639_004047 [Escallonia herrerae]